jgi:hypothetical protein
VPGCERRLSTLSPEGQGFRTGWSAQPQAILRGLCVRLRSFEVAKAKDMAITLGPSLVTADELEDYRHDGRLSLDLVAASLVAS